MSDVTLPNTAPESEQTPPEADVDFPAPPPDAPRPITPRVRRRAWAEPRVRAVALSALAASLACAYLLVSRYVEWRREAALVTQGTPVDALVTVGGTITLANKQVPPGTVVVLEYTVGGRKVTVTGTLKGRKTYITTGRTVPIRVDPEDPERWTALTEPRPMRLELIGGLIVLPFAAVLVAAALFMRWRVLSLWRDGVVTPAVVMDTRHTAVAPRTHAVRCTPVDPNDPRLLQAYVPARLGRPQQGDPLWLIARPAPSDRAVAAAWFE